ncbi:MAG: sugar dehydrogenase [Caulobacter sp.]|nr:sugar dehydrogenase [Caulobacter sp.]
MRVLVSLLFPLFLAAPAAAQPRATCDGYPRADIGMAKGYCAGLVVGPAGGRRMRLPRSLVQLPGGDWIVSDLGGWTTANGAVWRLSAAPGRPPRLTRLIGSLNLPHALGLGPDGRVYVGEMSRIFRFDPDTPNPAATIRPVITGLPDNRLHDNRHPLSKFVFAPDGALIVNVGAPSDQCLGADGRAAGPTCPELTAAAQLRRYAPDGRGGWSPEWTVIATGLRNSVALAQHPSGILLQGENSYDTSTRWAPFDEINVIGATGRHGPPDYGWPYCDAAGQPAPGWPSGDGPLGCGRTTGRFEAGLLLPPHAAPLDMLWYQGAMFPGLRGRLLMTWHGYRSTGGRLVAFETDSQGVPVTKRGARYPIYGGSPRAYGPGPAAEPLVLTPGWGATKIRKQGAPVGIAVAGDGAIWLADDKAGQVIRIAVDRP